MVARCDGRGGLGESSLRLIRFRREISCRIILLNRRPKLFFVSCLWDVIVVPPPWVIPPTGTAGRGEAIDAA